MSHRDSYGVTFAVINSIDLFIRNEYKQIILDSWEYCIKNKGLELYGHCIMTSHIHNTLDYIHENPVIAGIVEKAEDYLYSSARNYFGMKGMIDVIQFEPRVM